MTTPPVRQNEVVLNPDHFEDANLSRGELVPSGGTWSGLLFDNPSIGLAAQLTWEFTFEFADVERSYGSTPVTVTIDWVPISNSRWHSMAGRRAASNTFSHPIESSVYFFEHHRFDAASLSILDQRESMVHVVAEISGDIDRLGIDTIDLTAWLRFTGITVALTDCPEDEPAAMARLADFTDVRDLVATTSAHAYTFVPQHS